MTLTLNNKLHVGLHTYFRCLQKILAHTPTVKHITYMKGRNSVNGESVADGKNVEIVSMSDVQAKGKALGE